MSNNKKLKKAVRERMARTGESYSTARMHVLSKLQHSSIGAAVPPPKPGAAVPPPKPGAAVPPQPPGAGGPVSSQPTGGGGGRPDPYVIVENLMEEIGWGLPDDELIVNQIAMTNAFGWGLDDYDVGSVSYVADDRIMFTATVSLSGEQDEDKPWSGSQVDAEIEGSVVLDNGDWRPDEVRAVEAANDF